jgi:hypothetical protein
MEKLVKAVGANMQQAFAIEARLLWLADALEMTGNTKLAEQLDKIAEMVVQSANDVDQAFGHDFAAYINQTSVNSTNLLHAVLGGIKLGEAARTEAS